MKQRGILLGVIIFVILNIISYYMENYSDVRDYTRLDGGTYPGWKKRPCRS